MKKIFALYMVLLLIVSCIGCMANTPSETQETTGSGEDHVDARAFTRLTVNGTLIEEGMRYADVVEIMGSEGKDVGSGIFLIEWEMPFGKIHVGFNGSYAAALTVAFVHVVWQNGESIKEGMSYSDVIEIMGSEGKDVGSGIFLMEWELPCGKVRVGFDGSYEGELAVSFVTVDLQTEAE